MEGLWNVRVRPLYLVFNVADMSVLPHRYKSHKGMARIVSSSASSSLHSISLEIAMSFSSNLFVALVASAAVFAVANAEQHTVTFTNKLRLSLYALSRY